MKILVCLLVITSLPALAETMGARRTKEEMVKRTVDLEKHAKEARLLFKAEKIEKGCEEISYLRKNTRAHTHDVLGRMNIAKRSNRKMQDESVEVLQIIDTLHVDCKSENFSDVDPKFAARQLHKFADHMNDHRNRIEDRSVEFSNSYEYEYNY